MDDKLTIRRIRDEDSDIAASLAVDAFAEHAAKMSPDAWSVFAREIATLGSRTDSDEVLVAERNGDLVGMVVFYQDWRGAQQDSCNIRLLAVPPSARGFGIGSALMEQCIEECRQAGKARVVTAVAPDLGPVKQFCERLGFQRHPDLDHMPAPGVRAEGYQLLLDTAVTSNRG